jgi:hypothetical protein
MLTALSSFAIHDSSFIWILEFGAWNFFFFPLVYSVEASL